MSREPLRGREAYRVWRDVTTRWADNDAYGHVNNAVYYEWFDSAVNAWMIEQGMLDIRNGDPIALVVETCCTYAAPLAFVVWPPASALHRRLVPGVLRSAARRLR